MGFTCLQASFSIFLVYKFVSLEMVRSWNNDENKIANSKFIYKSKEKAGSDRPEGITSFNMMKLQLFFFFFFLNENIVKQQNPLLTDYKSWPEST